MIDLPWNIIVGNIISLVAGIFLILSMWVNDEKRAYKHQFLNAFVLMISSTDPAATINPPCAPAPGPISTR